jgi:hypothetical protein
LFQICSQSQIYQYFAAISCFKLFEHFAWFFHQNVEKQSKQPAHTIKQDQLFSALAYEWLAQYLFSCSAFTHQP